jgi:hypothetical protein
MPHRKHARSQLRKCTAPGDRDLLSHPSHVSTATVFTLCIHKSRKFYDHNRERKQKIKLKKKNNKQGTTGEKPGRNELSILTAHSSTCACKCCNRILFPRHKSSITKYLTGVRSISHAVVWFLLRAEKENLTLLFLIYHIWTVFYLPPVKTGVNAEGVGALL